MTHKARLSRLMMGGYFLLIVLMIPLAYASSSSFPCIPTLTIQKGTSDALTIGDIARVTFLPGNTLGSISTRIDIWATNVAEYEMENYVSVKGTFTANYSASCVGSSSCGTPTEPFAPALPIGFVLHFTVTNGAQMVASFNITTDGLKWWSTEFWLPKSSTVYQLIVTFEGYAEFQPTTAQTLLSIA